MGALGGRVAIVTGSSRGIGRAVACALAAAGADLALAARTTKDRTSRLPGTLEETADACRRLGAEVLVQASDLTKDEEIEALASATLERFSGVDVLINNAAISFKEEFLKTPMKIWDRAFRVNVRAPAYLCHLIAPEMAARGGGRILNISSSASVDFSVPWLSYSSSKAALEALTLGLARELAGHWVAVNAIRIEVPVATEGYLSVRPRGESFKYQPPSIIGEAAVWLVQQELEYTGNILTVAELRRLGAISTPDREHSPADAG